MNSNHQINAGFTALFAQVTERQQELRQALAMLKEDNDLELVYIAGKVTGLDYELVKQKFAAREAQLVERGYVVINPCNFVKEGTNWDDAMAICLNLLPLADKINLLPDWKFSEGATIEKRIADDFKIYELII